MNPLKNINISNIAKGTSNILNIVKKSIPIYKEIKPFVTKEKRIIEEKPNKKESNDKYNDSLTFFQ